MRRHTRALLALAAAFSILGGAASARAQSAGPLPIRIAWTVTPGQLIPLLGELAKRHPELMPHQGKSYAAEAVHFNGSTQQITAMAAGELEVAAFAPSSLALAVTNAHLDMRVVSDVIQNGVPGYFSIEYMVRADSGIGRIEDLKGKIVATNAIGGAADLAAKKMLLGHGLEATRDYQVVEIAFPNNLAAVEEKKIDLATINMPFAIAAHRQGNLKTLFTMGQAVGPSQLQLWAMTAGFIQAHRPALVDFFEDHIRGVRWFLDPRNRAEALAIAAGFTRQKPEDLAYAFTHQDFYRSPDCVPDLAAIQKEIDMSVELGILSQPVKLAPAYVDLSLIRDAKRRIDGK